MRSDGSDFGILLGLQVTAEHERDSAERHLRDVCRRVEVDVTIAVGRRDAVLRPQPLTREAEALDCRSEDRVEKDDLAVRA